MAEIVRRNTGTNSAAWVIWALLWIAEVILGLRFILRLIGANPAAEFTTIIYNLSSPLLTPFVNIIRSSRVATAGIFEWSTLIAMIVYWLIAWAIVRIIWFIASPSGGTYIERV